MALPLKPPPPPSPSLSFTSSLRKLTFLTLESRTPHHHQSQFFPKLPISISPSQKPSKPPTSPIQCISTHNHPDIDMVRTKDGIYAPKPKKVVVLWDLDNKPPRGPPYDAATSLRRVASRFGEVVEISAYANRHAFAHLPTWIVHERRERRHQDVIERKGAVVPDEPYVCGVCGRKCRTRLDLKKHFKQLHERERQKKLSRMNQLKGKKRKKFKERYVARNYKYEEAARELITPKVGYGLDRELRRAGVFVKTVEDKPQAADWALKRQMVHSMNRGIDWLFLVSDDSDFSDMLRKAREASLGTVVVGDWDRGALGRVADVWVPWAGVEKGMVKEEDLVPRGFREGRGDDDYYDDDEMFSVSGFDYGVDDERNELDEVVDELVVGRTGLPDAGPRVSAFSEGEEEADWAGEEERGYAGSFNGSDYLWDSDEEEEEDSEEEEDCYV